MIKGVIVMFCLFLLVPQITAQKTYNVVIYEGLDALVDSILTPEEAEHLKAEAELLLIFNEVNKLPCTSTIAYMLVESSHGKHVKKFNMTLSDYRGNYEYSSQHVNERASIWIDETFDEIGKYKIIIHKKNKVKPPDAEATFRMVDKGCNFVFRKMVLTK